MSHATPSTTPRRTNRGGCLKLALALIALVFAWSFATFKNQPSGPTAELANVSCETLVKDKLKAPSTATFSGQSATGGGNIWTSKGIVEAGNAFGGRVSHPYTCYVTFHEDETFSGRVDMGAAR